LDEFIEEIAFAFELDPVVIPCSGFETLNAIRSVVISQGIQQSSSNLDRRRQRDRRALPAIRPTRAAQLIQIHPATEIRGVLR
jgi:hypothetical protein